MPQWKGFLPLFTCLALLGMTVMPAHADEKEKDKGDTVVLLTLEWPPYTGIKLPGNGFVAQRVRAAYAAQGQDAKIGFFSWRRAMRLPYTDHRFTGFFPAYPSLERKQVCHLSEPVGVSPLGLAQLKTKPLKWTRVEDLSSYRIGVVTAYANEDTFDKLVKEGTITTVGTESDAENLLNLARGKVDGVVIDSHVFEWVLKNDARLRPYRDRLQMHERLLVTWPLFVCFRKDAEGAALRDRFNAGLASLHEDGKLSPEKNSSAVKQQPETPQAPKKRSIR